MNRQNIARLGCPRPLDLAACTNNTSGNRQALLDEKAHGERGRMPSTGNELAEK
jgi:hypothetical protein